MCKHPAILAPANGWSSAYFLRMDIKPGISTSANSISRRPKAARLMSATLYLDAGAELILTVYVGGGGMGRIGYEVLGMRECELV